jgi:hypothetical protein
MLLREFHQTNLKELLSFGFLGTEWNLKRPECKILPQNIPAYQTVDLTETIGVASLLPHWCIYSVDLPLVVYKLSEN